MSNQPNQSSSGNDRERKPELPSKETVLSPAHRHVGRTLESDPEYEENIGRISSSTSALDQTGESPDTSKDNRRGSDIAGHL